jgi:prolipoprotein diacylglyceryltransferase
MWGPYTIDRFANFTNAKLHRFNSKFWNPGIEAIYAFTQNWRNGNNWIVPPIDFVAKKYHKLSFVNAFPCFLYELCSHNFEY